ncbi:MAG: metal-binding protein [Cyanobacteria bacterium P01_F01_bin.150]
MPSGYIHDRITLWSLPFVVGTSMIRTQSASMTLAIASGFLLGGLMLGPDLDTRSIHYKRWGWFRWIWLPYRSRVKHRSPLSHGPILGTTVRVFYLLLWMLVLGSITIALLNDVLGLGWTWKEVSDRISWLFTTYWPWWIAFAIGLEIGAISHILADWSTSARKRFKKHYPSQGWRALGYIFYSSKPKKRRSRRKARGRPQK